MSDMFKKIINVLLAENIDFEITQKSDHYVICSTILKKHNECLVYYR